MKINKGRWISRSFTISMTTSLFLSGIASASPLYAATDLSLPSLQLNTTPSVPGAESKGLPVAPAPRDKELEMALREEYPFLTDEEIVDIQRYGGLTETCSGIARCCNGDEYTIQFGCILVSTYFNSVDGPFAGYSNAAPITIPIEASKAVCAESGGATQFTAIGFDRSYILKFSELSSVTGGRIENTKCPNDVSGSLSTVAP